MKKNIIIGIVILIVVIIVIVAINKSADKQAEELKKTSNNNGSPVEVKEYDTLATKKVWVQQQKDAAAKKVSVLPLAMTAAVLNGFLAKIESTGNSIDWLRYAKELEEGGNYPNQFNLFT